MVTSEPVDDNREPVKINGILSSASVIGPGALIIHAEVTKGSLPVTGMTVTATIDRPFTDPVSIQLLDNGAGADINKNDGVYSRYFTQYSNTGIYSVKIEVSATVGQGMVRKTLPREKQTESLIIDTDSSLTVRTRRQTSKEPLMVYISRSTTAGSFLYKNMAPSAALPYPSENIISDILPPARITDLTVLKTSHTDQTIVLSWTAPGDDFDIDTASSYDIMMSHDVQDMVNHQNTWKYISQNDILHGNLKTPKVAGVSEIFVLKVPFIPGEKVALVFSVRAVDKQGNLAEKSNFVTTAFGYLPDYVSKEYQPIIETVTESPDLPPPKEINVLVGIVGSLAVALFLTIILSLLLQKFGSSKSSDITKRDKSCVV
ncbi:calcium-activated chloride channel regulator 4A [Patella vulgata]|uniref:calcium-activated chloride channel regulator 4A n=1 Tax=Patella vulgata TaxID=6465 RepID=UPI0021806E5D|nr:calcium-activated chloride channel regulator 4A [Patella vulgata]